MRPVRTVQRMSMLFLLLVGVLQITAGAQNPPTQIANWKAMPDLVGVHLHMPLEAATASLKSQYPKLRFQSWLHNPLPINGPQTQVSGGVSVNYGGGGFADQINVDVTQPPGPQIVWHVSRLAERQNLNRGTLLAALRAKYGKETLATSGNQNNQALAKTDNDIVDIWWLYDEQGKRVSAPADPNTVRACGVQGAPGSQLDPNTIDTLITVQPWCSSSYVGVYVSLGYANEQIIDILRFEMTNIPLFIRAGKATLAARDAEMQRLQKNEIERSKQTKPKL